MNIENLVKDFLKTNRLYFSNEYSDECIQIVLELLIEKYTIELMKDTNNKMMEAKNEN